MLKVAITGPESSGKTSLAQILSKHYKVEWIPEFARNYLIQKSGKYTFEDLSYIAEKQFKAFSTASKNQELLIADTELLVIKIWSKVKYDKIAPLVNNYFKQQEFDIYLLCKPDIPWEYDELREHPEMREELFELYKEELATNHLPYRIIHGSEDERYLSATRIINQLLAEKKHKK